MIRKVVKNSKVKQKKSDKMGMGIAASSKKLGFSMATK